MRERYPTMIENHSIHDFNLYWYSEGVPNISLTVMSDDDYLYGEHDTLNNYSTDIILLNLWLRSKHDVNKLKLQSKRAGLNL